jgi:hypothetical protein
MNIGTDGLIACHVTLTVILLAIGLVSQWPWHWKAYTIILATLSYFIVYHAYTACFGWPVAYALPAKFRLLAVTIVEPDLNLRRNGDIFFWALDIDAGVASQPRAYQLPYSLSTYDAFAKARGKLRENIPQIGEIIGDHLTIGKATDTSQSGQLSSMIKFRDAPPGEGVPTKEAP